MSYFDTPSATNWLGTPKLDPKEVTYAEGIYVGYRYYNTFHVKPSYEFGYGLSYTSFKYSDLKLSSATFDDNLTATVTITNTGKVAGKEVAELYLSAPAKTLDKPAEELKGFAKTALLQPGQSETVTFTLNASDLASFSQKESAWVAEAGQYKVAIGASSMDIRQQATFTLPQTKIVEKVKLAFALDKDFVDLKAPRR